MDLTAGTRGEILKIMKARGQVSAAELSRELGLAPNAVRGHLLILEQAGFIEHNFWKRGRGRPTKMYRLAPRSEGLFPRHYDQLLEELIKEIGLVDGQHKLAQLVKGMAERWAADLAPNLRGLSYEEKLVAISRHLDLGGLMITLKKDDEGYHSFVVYNCVYLNTARRHREICRLIPTIIERLTGAKVTLGPTIHNGQSHCLYQVERVE